MANTKKRRRRSTTRPDAGGPAGAAPERRERKERARAAREAERKRERRRAAMRRAAWLAGVGVLAIAIVYWVQRVSNPRPVPQAAVQAAAAAGCTGVETPTSSAAGSLHLTAGASYSYSQRPATSGYHDPSPLPIPPHVYTAPIAETNAVHNLEHGAVIMYYRASGDGALPSDVVQRLTVLARSSPNTILAPHEDLPSGQALALTAWNKLQQCPATVTAAQARTIASGFIDAFVCTANAPEGKAGPGC